MRKRHAEKRPRTPDPKYGDTLVSQFINSLMLGGKKSIAQRIMYDAMETAQDYAEAIADLAATHGEARAVDLARRLGVSHVTVIRTIARLQRDGYVSTRPYRSIFLADKGLRIAEESRRRHEIVVAFLRALGVPDAIAQTDAEGIEHHVSPETLAAFKRHT